MKLLSPAIKAASAFTLGGAGFALSNLLLAKFLTTEAYGEFSLVLTVILLCTTLGPLGLEAVIVRHRPGPRQKLFGVSLITGSVLGLVATVLTSINYEIDAEFYPYIVAAIAAGTLARVSAAVYQSEKRFTASLWLIQGPFVTLLVAAFLVGWIENFQGREVIAAYTLHWTVAAVIGMVSLRRTFAANEIIDWQVPWKECPPLFGFLLTVQLAAQLDRLIIPKLLDIESLATFGVLSALVMAPFKMFQAGVGYTLVPRLRSAENRSARSLILVNEAVTMAVVVAAGAASGFIIAPWVSEIFLNGRYPLGPALVGSVVFAGSLRVLVMFVSSIVTALGVQSQLVWLNHGSWVALVVSVVGGWWGSQWGLPGLIFGFALGSLVRIAAAAWIAARVWRHPSNAETQAVAPT